MGDLQRGYGYYRTNRAFHRALDLVSRYPQTTRSLVTHGARYLTRNAVNRVSQYARRYRRYLGRRFGRPPPGGHTVAQGYGGGRGAKYSYRGRRKRKRRLTFKRFKKIYMRERNVRTSKYTWLKQDPFQIETAINRTKYFTISAQNIPFIDTLKGFLPTIVSGASDGQINAGSSKFSGYYARTDSLLRIRNNWSLPVNVQVFLVRNTEDTSRTIDNAIESDKTKYIVAGSSLAATFVPLMWDPTKGAHFKEDYKVVKRWTQTLNAGDSMNMPFKSSWHVHDPGVYATNGASFTKDEYTYLILLQGVVAHGEATKTDRVVVADGKVDCIRTMNVHVKYENGQNLKQSNFDDNLPTDGGTPTVVVPNVEAKTETGV